MKRLFWMGFILSLASLATAQNFTLGGLYGIGSVTTEEENWENKDLKLVEAFVGWFMDESTILELRAGRMEPRDGKSIQLDMEYTAVTVGYMFDTILGQQGLYAGPCFYSGDLVHNAVPPDSEPTREDVDKIGATGGIEGFFPLTQNFQIYGQVSGHYIPIDNEQLTFEVGIGFAFRF